MNEHFIQQNLQLVTFFPLILWGALSFFWLIRQRNIYAIESIPSGFTTAGVLGTFIGIAYGLYFFDVNNIENSIPQLLEGLKQAFYTSIVGIAASMVVGKIIEFFILKNNDLSNSPETAELKNISTILLESSKSNEENIKALVDQLKNFLKINTADQTKVLEEILQESRQIRLSAAAHQENQKTVLQGIAEASVDASKSRKELRHELVNQLDTLRKGEEKRHKDLKTTLEQNSNDLVQTLISNNKELSRQLAEMNSKELLKAMEKSVEVFNAKMEDILKRLIKKNFEQLNNSVQQLNHWQVQNKENLEQLIQEFNGLIDRNKQFSVQLETTSGNIQENLQGASTELKTAADQTKMLTADNGRLQKIVEELQGIVLGDNQFKTIINQAMESIENMNSSTHAFQEGMEKVEELKNNLFRVQETMISLVTELRELAKIKDVNEGYWQDVKMKMEEGLGTLNGASQRLGNDLENIDAQFKDNLHQTFLNLDKLIKGYIMNVN